MTIGAPSPRAPGSPLGLIPFVVPNWPDPQSHADSVDRILRHGPVAWEIAVPSAGWSARTSEVIGRALTETEVSFDGILGMAVRLRPNVAVIYEGLCAALGGRERVLDRIGGRIDHVMLEWEASDREAWQAGLAARGIGWVQTADAHRVVAEDIAELCDSLALRSIFYVSWAPATGADTYSVDVLRAAVQRVKGRRPDLFVMTGFGIRDAEQVRRLVAIEGLDAAAVGTALLECTRQGVEAVDAFFGTLAAAAAAPVAQAVAEGLA